MEEITFVGYSDSRKLKVFKIQIFQRKFDNVVLKAPLTIEVFKQRTRHFSLNILLP